jgi:hypothetical protein
MAAIVPMLAIGQLHAQGAVRRQEPTPRASERRVMEQRVRQGLWRAAKQRAGLTDDQMNRLARSSERFEGRRRTMLQEERRQRQILRAELAPRANPNQERVGVALDRLLVLQRDRLDLQIEEQRELAAFMTPVQRARFLALQEQVRRRVQSLQGRRAGAGAGGGSALPGAP